MFYQYLKDTFDRGPVTDDEIGYFEKNLISKFTNTNKIETKFYMHQLQFSSDNDCLCNTIPNRK